jgi:hypothetical protein
MQNAMRNKIVIVERGEDGIAILDTPKKRILFTLMLFFCIVFSTLNLFEITAFFAHSS